MDDPTTTPEVSQPHVVGPPTRRRSRWLKIAAVVLVVLVGGLWWLSRPTIDPRFVGTWDWHGGVTTFSGGFSSPNGRITFESNGTAVLDNEYGQRKCDWWVNSDGYVGIEYRVYGSNKLLKERNRLIARVTGDRNVGRDDLWKVWEASESQIVLRSAYRFPARQVRFKRVSPADPVR